jgi:hypothetical protein
LLCAEPAGGEDHHEDRDCGAARHNDQKENSDSRRNSMMEERYLRVEREQSRADSRRARQ